MTTRDQQRIEVIGRWVAGLVTTGEAVALLGCSERTAWRRRAAFLERGADGLVHGNRGRASPRRLGDGQRGRIVELARGLYRGVNDCHLAELLAEVEGIVIGRSSLQRLLRGAGVASPRRRRPPRYRSRRERMAQAGLLVQLDGSRHDWLEGRGPGLTLVGGIDDATGIVVGATFRDDEDGTGYLLVLRDMAERHGLPAAVYRDRAGIFAPTRPGRWAAEVTQVGRAFAELGITSIAAQSPQAKGRVERLWGTFQDRLVSTLRLAGATDRASANHVLWSSCRSSTSASASLPRSRPRRGALSHPTSTWPGCARSAGGGRSATTTRSGSRAPSSSCQRAPVVEASPGVGWRSSCVSTVGSSSRSRDGSCWRSPPRPSRVASRRSASSPRGDRQPLPEATFDLGIGPGWIIRGTGPGRRRPAGHEPS